MCKLQNIFWQMLEISTILLDQKVNKTVGCYFLLGYRTNLLYVCRDVKIFFLCVTIVKTDQTCIISELKYKKINQ